MTCLAFTADSRRLVSGDKEQTVKVWDVTHPPEGHAFQVTTVGSLGEWVANLAFADGQSLRVADLNKTDRRFHARRWGVEEERQIAENPLLALGTGPTAVDQEVSLSADGRWLAVSVSGEPGTVRVCDMDSTEHAGTIRTGAAQARPLALTADGRLIAYLGWGGRAGADDPRVELGVAENSGTIKAHIELLPDRTIIGACFSPDNRLLAAAEARSAPKADLLAAQPPWEIVVWEAATCASGGGSVGWSSAPGRAWPSARMGTVSRRSTWAAPFGSWTRRPAGSLFHSSGRRRG